MTDKWRDRPFTQTSLNPSTEKHVNEGVIFRTGGRGVQSVAFLFVSGVNRPHCTASCGGVRYILTYMMGNTEHPHRRRAKADVRFYIYLIDRVRGPYWENIGPRSWQYGPSRFGEVRTKKTEGRYSPSTARANSVNKIFITRLLVSEKTRTANATSIQRAKIAKIKLIVFVGFLVQL